LAKITFLGNFQVDFSSENHHAKSLEVLGHTVVRFQEGRGTTIGKVLREASTSNLFVWVHTHGWETPGQERVDIIRELRESNVPTMTYHLDLWFGLKRQNDLENDPFYKNIGHFFATDKLMADWFNENTAVRGHFLPAAVFGPECYIHPDYDGTFDYDVIFVGSKGYHPEYPYRPELVNFLRDTYGSRFLHVGGDGDTGVIRGDDLNRIYARSKIAIGDTLNIDFKYPYYSSDRLFESTGRGGFTIYPNIFGLDAFFEDKKEIVFYEHGNLKDLKTKIDYYLEHDEERESIRVAGHERAKNEHTYKHRWATILKELGIK
jgi:hypothetical protein